MGGGKVRVIVKLCKVAILILISVGSYFLVRFSDLISLSILLLTIYHLPFNLQGCNSHPNLSWILFWVRFSDLKSLSILLLTIYHLPFAIYHLLCKVAILILISVGSYFLVRFSDLISLSILLLTIYHLPFNLQGCNSHPNLSWILFWVRFSDLISLSILLLTIYRDRSEARIMTRGRQYIHGHRASMLAGVITLHC